MAFETSYNIDRVYQGLDMQFLKQSLGFLALMPKEVRTMNF
ncbi:hypothetical protein HPHPA5_0380 [Helicobacter pylori Hp A-5]|nr:hypothetical protein HPHPA5_0380 [Helicobacter pylori Hp A-5]